MRRILTSIGAESVELASVVDHSAKQEKGGDGAGLHLDGEDAAKHHRQFVLKIETGLPDMSAWSEGQLHFEKAGLVWYGQERNWQHMVRERIRVWT